MSRHSVITKMHFVFGLVMFFFVALMVVEDDLARRAFLLLPIITLDILSKILFSLDQIDRLDSVLERYKGGGLTYQTAFACCYMLAMLSQSLFWRNLAIAFCRNRTHCMLPARA